MAAAPPAAAGARAWGWSNVLTYATRLFLGYLWLLVGAVAFYRVWRQRRDDERDALRQVCQAFFCCTRMTGVVGWA